MKRGLVKAEGGLASGPTLLYNCGVVLLNPWLGFLRFEMGPRRSLGTLPAHQGADER